MAEINNGNGIRLRRLVKRSEWAIMKKSGTKFNFGRVVSFLKSQGLIEIKDYSGVKEWWNRCRVEIYGIEEGQMALNRFFQKMSISDSPSRDEINKLVEKNLFINFEEKKIKSKK